MYCTKCGKETHDQDRFCAFCGAELRQPNPTKYDNIVFNPPFREEAKKKTEEAKETYTGFKSDESVNRKAIKREKVELDWGIEKRESKRHTDDTFDWSQVLEERNRKIEGIDIRSEQIERHAAVSLKPAEPDNKAVDFAEPLIPITVEAEEEPMSIEDLERELFGEKPEKKSGTYETADIPKRKENKDENTAGKAAEEKAEHSEPKLPVGDERFYTYNQKCDAFDELIRKEKERVGAEPRAFGKDKRAQEKAQQGGLYIPPEKTIAVEPIGKYDNLAPTIQGEWIDGEFLITSPISEIEPEEYTPILRDLDKQNEENEQNAKLRYSDVFPRVPVDENGNPIEGYKPEPEVSVRHDPVVPGIIAKNKERQAEERKNAETHKTQKRPERTVSEAKLTGIFDAVEIDEDEPKKKHVFARIVIWILILLLVCEGIILAVKFFIPDSLFSQWITDTSVKVLDVISGKTEKTEDEPITGESSQESYMRMLVADASVSSKKIGEITYANDVKYSGLSSYAFPEAETAAEFADEDWFVTSAGEQKTYGQVLMSTLIKYFDGWNDINNDESLAGINKLEIGETKIGEEGFYTLARITYACSDGTEIVKYQTIYTRIADESIVINMVKEENN